MRNFSYAAIFFLLTASIFLGYFPDCYIEGIGLTPFKVVSEYVISAVFLAAIVLLIVRRGEFDNRIWLLLVSSIALNIVSELAFTLYVDVYGPANLIGHFLKILAFYLIYKAITETSLVDPYKSLFRDLKQSEERFRFLFEQAPIPYQSLDENGRILTVNQTWLDSLGYTREEVAGKWFGEFLTQSSQEDFEQRFACFKSDGEVRDIEFEMVRKNGSTILVSLKGKIGRDGERLADRTHCVFTDITESRRMERELRESEAKFRSIFETNVVPIVYARIDGRILDANDAYLDLLGFSRKRLNAGKLQWEAVTPPDWKHADESTFEYLRDAGVCPPLERELLRQDGTRVPVLLGACLIPGESEQLVAFAVDLTERKRMEEELRKVGEDLETQNEDLYTAFEELRSSQQALAQSHERYRIMGEILPYGVWWCDSKGRVQYVSPSFSELLGMMPSDHKDPIWMRRLPPEDVEPMKEKWSHCIQTGGPWEHEHRIIDENGNIHTVLSRGLPVRDKMGNITSWAGINLDITERKRAEETLRESEERFRAVVESAPEAIFIQTQKRFAYLNPAAVDLFGVPSANRLLGRLVSDQYHPDFRELVGERIRRLNEEREPVPLIPQKVLRSDGSVMDVEVSAVPFVHNNQKGALVFVRDITDRKEAEEELRKAHDELESRVKERTAELLRANEELRLVPSRLISVQEEERKRLAGELHDSIGQTLAALKFSVELALSTRDRGDPEGALKLLEQFVPTLQRSIEETRAIYMGLRPKTLEEMGLVVGLQWFRREFMSLYPKHHIELVTDIEEQDIPEALKIVIFRIAQEALNNIAKHSKAEWVDLSLVRTDGGIELIVADDGVGMDLDRILKTATARSLGLTGMKERAEFTGGTLTLESEPNEGTTVRAFWNLKAGGS